MNRAVELRRMYEKKMQKQRRIKQVLIVVLLVSMISNIILLSRVAVSSRDKVLLQTECNTLENDLSVSESLCRDVSDIYEAEKSQRALLESQIQIMNAELNKVKQEFNEYRKATGEYFINQYEITESEINTLNRIVEAEATGQDFNSKVHVAHVIMNRVLSESFPDTIQQVVFQSKQFQPTFDGRYWEVEITDSTIDAVYYALRSQDSVQGALYFMQESASDSDNVNWFKGKLEYVMSDNSGHSFYK